MTVVQLDGLGRTPWVDRNLKAAWERVEAQVERAWMPELEPGRKFSVDELGCGYYGCVMRTAEPDLVLKISTDITEAMFAQNAINLGDWPEGIVRYNQVVALGGVSHRKRPVFLLWREEAFNIGFPGKMVWGGYEGTLSDYERRSAETLMWNLASFRDYAQVVRSLTLKSNPATVVADAKRYEQFAYDFVAERTEYRGDKVIIAAPRLKAEARLTFGRDTPRAVAVALRCCELISEIMENTYMNDTIGGALSFYQAQGVLLADVHADNVGQVRREGEGYELNAITDPGHAIPLQDRWLNADIVTI